MTLLRLVLAGLAVVLGASGCGARVGGATTSSSRPPATGGVQGKVTASPTCPVERAAPRCRPRPVATRVRLVSRSGSTVASARSSRSGQFKMAVPPGTYEVVAIYPGPGRGCPPQVVVVSAGKWSTAELRCDTGIR